MKFCKRFGLVQVHGNAKYCKECKQAAYYEHKIMRIQEKKERERREMAEKGISRDLDQDVARLCVINDKRHAAGLPPLSYGKWRAVEEGRIVL